MLGPDTLLRRLAWRPVMGWRSRERSRRRELTLAPIPVRKVGQDALQQQDFGTPEEPHDTAGADRAQERQRAGRGGNLADQDEPGEAEGDAGRWIGRRLGEKLEPWVRTLTLRPPGQLGSVGLGEVAAELRTTAPGSSPRTTSYQVVDLVFRVTGGAYEAGLGACQPLHSADHWQPVPRWRARFMPRASTGPARRAEIRSESFQVAPAFCEAGL